MYNLTTVVQCTIEGERDVPRPRGYATPWRELQHLLVEWAEGGAWVLERRDRPALTVPPGRVHCVRPGTPHRLRVLSGKLTTNWALMSFVTSSGMDIAGRLELPDVLPPDESHRVMEQVGEVFRAMDADYEREPVSLARGHRAMYAVLETLATAAGDGASLEVSPGHARVLPVLSMIDIHLSEHLSRSSLARVANLSPTRFHYVFSEAMGMAPMEYVRTQRLKRSQELLRTTPLPVREIASQCGYRSAQYFSRVFSQSTGYTPGEFRKAFGGKS